MTSPGRLYSSRGRGAHAGREGLEVRDPQLTALQQQCAAATERCQELEATLREKDMEVGVIGLRAICVIASPFRAISSPTEKPASLSLEVRRVLRIRGPYKAKGVSFLDR